MKEQRRFPPHDFEMIIEWKDNKAGIRLQKLRFKEANFISAVKKALYLVGLLQKVGGYPQGSNRLVAVSYYNALKQYDEEHYISYTRNKQELQEAVKKILESSDKKLANSKNDPIMMSRISSQPMKTVRTRSG